MSTATVPTAAVATPNQGGADQLIEERIEEACRALWWAELVRESLRTLVVAAVAVIVWVIVDQWIFSPSVSVRFVACAVLAGWCLRQFLSRILPLLGSSIQPEYAARSLERDLPEMKQALTSYVTLHNQRQQPGLRSRVVRTIGSRVAGRLRTHDALPAEATGTLTWWLVAAAVMALFVIYAALSPKSTLASVGRLAAPLASIEPPKRVSISEVLPGDIDAIAGRGLDVSALVDGLGDDERVWCRWHTASRVQETELEFDEAELRFAGSIELDHAAMGKVAYYIEAGDAKSGPYWLSVENVPVVALQSVRYEPLAYTGEVAHTSSSGAITAIDGTKVTIRAGTNRAIEKATIEFNPRRLGQTVRATAGTKSLEIDESGTRLSITFPLRSAHGRSAAVQLESYRIRVWDATEQTNPDPIVYPIRVIADLPPEVSIVMPRKTPKNLSLDGQQVIEVHAMDPDFGLKQVKVEVRRGIDVVAEPSLWSNPVGAKGNQVTEYRFRPTEHGLRVGDVVKVAAVAIDNRDVPEDPSIEPNIARTDAIELRIVESEPLPAQGEGEDGLSAPDDRPASDDKGDQQSQSDSATDDTGQSDQQQNGGGGGEGTSAQQDGDSGQGNQTGEKSGEGSGKSGEKTQGEKGSGTGGETESGKDADPAQGGGEPNQGDAGGEADPNNSNSQNQSPADNTGQDNKQTPSDADSQSDQPDSESNQDPGTDGSGGPSEGNAGDGTEGATQNDGSRQPTGDPGSGQTPEGGQSDSAADAPPKHDGEAFDRIRDYLDKKKQEQSESNDQQGEQSKGQQSKDQGDQESETGSQSERTDRNEKGDGQNGEQQKTGPKGSNDPQAETGSEQSKGDPSSGDQTGTDANSKDPRESASERKDGSGQQETGAGASKDSQQKPSGQESTTGKQPDESGKQPDGSDPRGSATDDQRSDGSESGDQTGDGGNKDSTPGSDQKTPSGNEQGSDDPSKSEGSGDQSKADQGTGDQSQTDQGAGDQAKSDPGAGDRSKTDQGNESRERSGDEPSDSGESGTEGKPDNNTQPTANRPQESGDPKNNSSTPPQGAQSQASGDGSGTSDGDDASQPPPAQPDLEYTKKATDMVLDYLKETRDKPDSDLLEELNWSEEDLKRFADRWKKVRDLDQSGLPDAETNADVEEALRSLGMRPQASDEALQNQDKADSLRGIRDSGNRKPPPAAYRDVFEAFRRAVGRQ